MADIVTLDEVKLHCRVLHDDEDFALENMIEAATETVLATADAWDGTGTAPARLKLAILARVADSYDNREAVPAAKNERALLQPLRVLDL